MLRHLSAEFDRDTKRAVIGRTVEVKGFGSNNMRQFIACPHVHNANFCDIRPKKLRRHSRKLISGHKWIFKNPSLL